MNWSWKVFHNRVTHHSVKKYLTQVMAGIQKCSYLTTKLQVMCITSVRLAACLGEVEEWVDSVPQHYFPFQTTEQNMIRYSFHLKNSGTEINV
jgi:hypothetical protein